jgi:hypothetical protein
MHLGGTEDKGDEISTDRSDVTNSSIVVPVGSPQSENSVNLSAQEGARILDDTNSRLQSAPRAAPSAMSRTIASAPCSASPAVSRAPPARIDIDQALQELNAGLDQRWGCKADIVVSMHAGHAALSHIGQGADTIVAAGKALEIAQELRKMAARNGKSFAISSDVFSAAQTAPPTGDALTSGRFGRQDHSGLFGQDAQIKEIKMLFD